MNGTALGECFEVINVYGKWRGLENLRCLFGKAPSSESGSRLLSRTRKITLVG